MARELTADAAQSEAIALEIVEVFERHCPKYDTDVILIVLGTVIAAIGAQIGLPTVLATIERVAMDTLVAAATAECPDDGGGVMRGKVGTAHPGRTAAQRRVLDAIGRGNHSPTMSTSTRDAMLRSGLIVEAGYRTVDSRFGAIRIAELKMPIPVHMRWCAAMAAECPDEDA